MVILGIDVSKDKIDVAWIKDPVLMKVKTKVFKNSANEIEKLIQWAERNTKLSIDNILFVMEATGVYHEPLAYGLVKAGALVSVVNPAKISAYSKSRGSRSKTDKKDSITIARYGASESPSLWQPEPEEIRQLKALIARYQAVEKDLQREQNRLEKAQVGQVCEEVLESIKYLIAELKKELERLSKLIDKHIDKYPQLKKDKQLLTSIPGVGPIISNLMLALIRSRDFKKATQCSAFLGLNPVHHESGSSVRGRSHMSKMGNAKIRAKLYMAAVVATQHNPDIKQQYQRLLANGKSKMSALCAAMRKLVQICFGVIKHQATYQPQVSI